MAEQCNVSDQFCEASPGVEGTSTRGMCFACGLPVCRKCSTVLSYYTYGRRRVCNNCQVEHDGERGERRVMSRLYKLAGY